MVRLLGELHGLEIQESPASGHILRGAVYEHIHVCGNILKICGEGIMTQGGPLKLQVDFFGADEALTNFMPGGDPWVATLIFCAANRQLAREKRDRCIAEITGRFKIREVVDSFPSF